MSLAADTREAVRRRPTLYNALQAGILNYTAAADSLDIDGDTEAIATALRRFGESLSTGNDEQEPARSLTVRMEGGIDRVDTDARLAVDGVGFDGTSDRQPASDIAAESPSLTAIQATGDVDSDLLATVLDRLWIEGIAVRAAGVAGDALIVVVPRRAGPTALRLIETAA